MPIDDDGTEQGEWGERNQAHCVLIWSEDEPGWTADAHLAQNHGKQFDQVTAEAKVTLGGFNPLRSTVEAVDLLCMQANIHPRRLTRITIEISAAELYDVKDRLRFS